MAQAATTVGEASGRALSARYARETRDHSPDSSVCVSSLRGWLGGRDVGGLRFAPGSRPGGELVCGGSRNHGSATGALALAWRWPHWWRARLPRGAPRCRRGRRVTGPAATSAGCQASRQRAGARHRQRECARDAATRAGRDRRRRADHHASPPPPPAHHAHRHGHRHRSRHAHHHGAATCSAAAARPTTLRALAGCSGARLARRRTGLRPWRSGKHVAMIDPDLDADDADRSCAPRPGRSRCRRAASAAARCPRPPSRRARSPRRRAGRRRRS